MTREEQQVKDLDHHYDKVVNGKDYFNKPDICVLKGKTKNGLKLFMVWEDFYAMELDEYKKYLFNECGASNEEIKELETKIKNDEYVGLMCCMSTEKIGDIGYVVGPHFDFIETKEE